MRGRAGEELDAEFVAFVDQRARRHVRAAVLLTGDWHAAEDLVQTCLVELYRAWPRLDPGVDLDAYLRRMLVNAHRSWWRARWRREAPVATIPDRAGEADGQDRHASAAVVRQARRALLVVATGDGPAETDLLDKVRRRVRRRRLRRRVLVPSLATLTTATVIAVAVLVASVITGTPRRRRGWRRRPGAPPPMATASAPRASTCARRRRRSPRPARESSTRHSGPAGC